MESGQAELNIIEILQQTDGKHIWSNTKKIPLRDQEGNDFYMRFDIRITGRQAPLARDISKCSIS
jgi:hypothetical protein